MVPAHHRGVVHGREQIGRRAGARVAEALQGHDLYIPGNARDSDIVVSRRADGACDVCAVAVNIHGVCVTVGEVPAVDVVHIAVAVVVDTVAGNFAGIHPDVVGEVGMGVVNTRVDDSDDDAARARRDFPCFRCVDVCVWLPTKLSCVVQAPELRKVRVVGVRRLVLKHKIWLDIRHTGLCSSPREDFGLRGTGRGNVVVTITKRVGIPTSSEDKVCF